MGRELRGLELVWCRFTGWWARQIILRIPRLVWVGDEVDVTVTFTQDPLDPDDPIAGLYSGGFAEIEKQLRHMGIKFDTGQGFNGRDWEWDWSLSGPINVRFRGCAREPGKRRDLPRPMLVQ